MTLNILFWISIFLLFHSYVLYPFILKILARNKKENSLVFTPDDDLPFISVIIAAHNEEMVIVEKIRSIYYTLYPLNKFEVLVGSDASTDGTNRICKVYTENYQGFRFFPFDKRQGKPSVVNQLVEQAKGELLVLTDAKVFFTINTLFELVKHFKNEKIHIVGGGIQAKINKKDGISFQEKAFMSREIRMKDFEGKIWGQTMGIYGAIYAIRKSSFQPVPENFSVDDFFITLKVLQSGKKAIMNTSAISHEEVPNLMKTEFKRKIRISSGNFQNAFYFFRILLKPWTSLSFIFMSHKIIRWIGPFLILLGIISLSLLSDKSDFYFYLFILQNILLIIPLIDIILRKFNIHIVLLRFITHFAAMNIALLLGFYKYLFGVKTNIWQPTKR
ncbi:MAG: glycosyltransferase [Bacteroidales bacterium]|nr:glycosyltransferase [Bacteroidales bacterium]MCF8391445.1 glycosyltransferase [Bacteroidales bacterium]